jgi:hypothetical protein
MDVSTTANDEIALPDPQTSRQLFRLGLGALIAGALWLVYKSELTDAVLLTMGAASMFLAALPALNWARNGELHCPVFEMFMLTSIPFYSVPLLAGHPDVLRFSDAATNQAAIALLLFQAAAIVTFFSAKARPIRSEILTVSLLPAGALRYAQTGMWLNTAYLYASAFLEVIPDEFGTMARAMFFGIGTVSLFIEMRRWGTGLLPSATKFAIAFNVFVQLVILFRSLYLIVGISVLLLALIGYVSTSRRIPVFAVVIFVPLLAVLHTGKSRMRIEYWGENGAQGTVSELPEFFVKWIEYGLSPPVADEDDRKTSLAGKLFERASLFQMLCLVTERTPEDSPYLLGESYRFIPAQLVPSILWPDKPSSLLSNVLLAIHYKLVSASAPTSVSIAFGMIAESYANFGLFGCVLLGVVLGYGYKRLSLAAVGRPQFSAIGLTTILLAAWSFQVEQIFASWLVSMIQAAFVVIGGPIAFRIMFGSH